jgi:hypothetical protein
MTGLIGLELTRENNRDARRAEASVAGSTAAWSRWSEQVLDGQPDLKIDALLQLHPLLPDHDLPVWHIGAHAVTLDDLVGRIVTRDQIRIHRGEVSHEYDDDVSSYRFSFAFKVSDELVIIPRYRRVTKEHFPWLLGVAPIDYQSRLEAELTRQWGGFEEHEDDNRVVGRVDDIEIYRSVTVYRRTPTA